MALSLGKMNRMTVSRKVDFGIYLDGGPTGDILLPKRYVPKGTKIGDELDVFIYLDQEERPVATTQKPIAMVGDFAYLNVAWTNEHGAFLDWGLMKDVFCPFREQKMRMEKDKAYIVHIHVDEDSYRIMASAKIEKFLSKDFPEYKQNTEVKLLIWQKTDLGFKVIVDNKYQGLIYDNQIFRELHTGDRLKGFVSSVRSDGKLDITLQKHGREQTLDFSERLHEYLFYHDGYCPFTDKSPAEEIYNEFHVSKKVFKRAVGDLYKQHLISLAPDGIELKGGHRP
ncbi:MAG: S1-like domain-containing RNA-binding protein [Bacteroidales bacterium]|nr:S1-like domain-containing RNA-binding protein [Bacteroidales bacterium]MCM1146442.1 S1-like domain-containing RNA-binding protein [Bacteroidales bacterium]MCM1205120.1 S1-like domain-containing RNA-binding protein [Bacillota bacterium]MCM1509367.1 S1-like domain-containing RNA-binding protein [Clostridium sp.]